MKKVLFAVVAVLLMPASAAMGQAWSQVDNSPHDFVAGNPSSVQYNGLAAGLCESCHVPHSPATTISPLWNHAVNAAATYSVLYSSLTMETNPSTVNESSRLCLGCHDGTLNVDNFGGGADAQGLVNASANIGTNLGDDHPVSIDYAAAASTDGGLVASTPTSLPLRGGQVECASCHNPHGEGQVMFLRLAPASLCGDCHTK